jgi:hypothetical protein
MSAICGVLCSLQGPRARCIERCEGEGGGRVARYIRSD